MILAHCLKCEFYEKVEIDHRVHSKCNKENCLSIYSSCVRVTAINKFVSENDLSKVKDQSSALEICYPLAQETFLRVDPLVPHHNFDHRDPSILDTGRLQGNTNFHGLIRSLSLSGCVLGCGGVPQQWESATFFVKLRAWVRPPPPPPKKEITLRSQMGIYHPPTLRILRIGSQKQ